MRRWLIIIASFFVAGAVVNVAVAWACAALQRGYSSFQQISATKPATLHAFGKQLVCCGNDPQLLPDWSVRGLQQTRSVLLEEAAGWPLLSFRCVVWNADPTAVKAAMLGAMKAGKEPVVPCPTLEGGILRGGERNYRVGAAQFAFNATGSQTIPFIPIWFGLTLNTVFYSATLAALAWLPLLTLRRHIRRRRGLCPKCAYPTGHSDVCSECGSRLAQRAVV